MQKYLKDINMKIVNTYKQESITWFEYKSVYSFMSVLHISISNKEVLSGWEAAKLITKRTKDTV